MHAGFVGIAFLLVFSPRFAVSFDLDPRFCWVEVRPREVSVRYLDIAVVVVGGGGGGAGDPVGRAGDGARAARKAEEESVVVHGFGEMGLFGQVQPQVSGGRKRPWTATVTS